MTMFIHFFCLCPLCLTIRLNFNISKVAYWVIMQKKMNKAKQKINFGELHTKTI